MGNGVACDLAEGVLSGVCFALEETKDYEPCATVFNPRITKHCDLRGEGVGNGVACDLAEGVLSGVCFALREMVGGFIGERHARWCSGAEW